MAFFDDLTMKYTQKNGSRHVQLMLSERVFDQWQRLVASMKAMNLLHRAMLAVSYRCIAMANKMASKVGVFFIIVLLIVTLAAAGAIRSK